SADELHDALLWMHALTDDEIAANPPWRDLLDALRAQRRMTRLLPPPSGGGAGDEGKGAPSMTMPSLWTAVERLPVWQAALPGVVAEPGVEAPEEFARIAWERDAALVEIVRGRLQGLGPTTAAKLAQSLGIDVA